MNLRQIEIFRAVMITGSISGASKLLFVSQPAVSRLLSHTELRMGLKLFERVKGRLYSTPEARSLFKEVEKIYDNIQRVNALAAKLSNSHDGMINILSSPSIGQMFIPKVIASFTKKYQQATVSFHVLPFAKILDRITSGDGDLAVTILPTDHPNIACDTIGSRKLVCVLPNVNPLSQKPFITLTDLTHENLISYRVESPLGKIIDTTFQQAGLTPTSYLEVGSPQNACSLVQEGVGVALVDEFSAISTQSPSVVVRQVINAPTIDICLLHLSTSPLSSNASLFAEEIRLLLAETLPRQ